MYTESMFVFLMLASGCGKVVVGVWECEYEMKRDIKALGAVDVCEGGGSAIKASAMKGKRSPIVLRLWTSCSSLVALTRARQKSWNISAVAVHLAALHLQIMFEGVGGGKI